MLLLVIDQHYPDTFLHYAHRLMSLNVLHLPLSKHVFNAAEIGR